MKIDDQTDASEDPAPLDNRYSVDPVLQEELDHFFERRVGPDGDHTGLHDVGGPQVPRLVQPMGKLAHVEETIRQDTDGSPPDIQPLGQEIVLGDDPHQLLVSAYYVDALPLVLQRPRERATGAAAPPRRA